jgi:hypothetical protein
MAHQKYDMFENTGNPVHIDSPGVAKLGLDILGERGKEALHQGLQGASAVAGGGKEDEKLRVDPTPRVKTPQGDIENGRLVPSKGRIDDPAKLKANQEKAAALLRRYDWDVPGQPSGLLQTERELKGRMLREKDPVKRLQLETAVSNVQADKESVLKQWATYATKEEVTGAIENLEKESLDSMHKVQNLASEAGRKSAMLEIRSAQTTPERRDELHELLGHKKTNDITDPLFWGPDLQPDLTAGILDQDPRIKTQQGSKEIVAPNQAEGFFGKARTYPRNITDPKVKERVAKTQQFIMNKLNDPTISDEYKSQWQDMLYKEVLDAHGRTGTYELRNVAFISGWEKGDSGIRVSQVPTWVKRMEFERKEALKRMITAHQLRLVHNIGDTQYTNELRQIFTPKEAPVEKETPLLTEGEGAPKETSQPAPAQGPKEVAPPKGTKAPPVPRPQHEVYNDLVQAIMKSLGHDQAKASSLAAQIMSHPEVKQSILDNPKIPKKVKDVIRQPIAEEKAEPTKPAAASTKAFITKADEAKLREFGYSQADINKIRPEEVGAIIQAHEVGGDYNKLLEVVKKAPGHTKETVGALLDKNMDASIEAARLMADGYRPSDTDEKGELTDIAKRIKSKWAEAADAGKALEKATSEDDAEHLMSLHPRAVELLKHTRQVRVQEGLDKSVVDQAVSSTEHASFHQPPGLEGQWEDGSPKAEWDSKSGIWKATDPPYTPDRALKILEDPEAGSLGRKATAKEREALLYINSWEEFHELESKWFKAEKEAKRGLDQPLPFRNEDIGMPSSEEIDRLASSARDVTGAPLGKSFDHAEKASGPGDEFAHSQEVEDRLLKKAADKEAGKMLGRMEQDVINPPSPILAKAVKSAIADSIKTLNVGPRQRLSMASAAYKAFEEEYYNGNPEAAATIIRSLGGDPDAYGGLKMSLFGLDVLAKLGLRQIKGFAANDLGPGLQSIRNIAQALRRGIMPRSGKDSKVIDTVMKGLGGRGYRAAKLDFAFDAFEKAMGNLPKAEQVAFVDQMKRSGPFADPVQQELADMMRGVEMDTWIRVADQKVRAIDDNKVTNLWNSMPRDLKETFAKNLSNLRADPNLGRGLKKLVEGMMNFKDAHYRVMWKTVPGSAQAKLSILGLAPTTPAGGAPGSRQLRGTQGFQFRSTLADMSEGLAKGGEPWDYNPVTMWKLAQMDAERYITAYQIWNDAKDQGARQFVRGENATPPPGFDRVHDSIGSVKFPVKAGMVHAGYWAVREDYAQLLNNLLSKDIWRDRVNGKDTIPGGRGLMALKNELTAYRLGFSPFHALTTSVSAVGSQMGLGLKELNDALRGGSWESALRGVKDITSSIAAPYLYTREGTRAIEFLKDPDEFFKTHAGQDFARKYPEAEQMMRNFFDSGGRLALHEDERLSGIRNLQSAWANRDWDNNFLGTSRRLLWHIPRAANQWLFRPLFNYYIPRAKLGAFLKEYSNALVDHRADLASGHTTETEIGRKTWDSIEDMFGQVNWDKFFWDRTLKSSMQLFFRAAQWFAGNIRFTSNALFRQTMEIGQSAEYAFNKLSGTQKFNPPPSTTIVPRLDPNFAKLAGLFITWTAANMITQTIAQQTKDNDPALREPFSLRDLMAGRIGGYDPYGHPRRITFPAIVFKDALSLWAQGPKTYIAGKTSDLISGFWDVLNNSDFQHNMIHNPDDSYIRQSWDDLKRIVGYPIGVGNVIKSLQQGEPTREATLGMSGLYKPPREFNWTPAERILYGEVERGIPLNRKPEEVEHYRALGKMRNELRSGKMTEDDLGDMLDKGTITEREANALVEGTYISPLVNAYNRPAIKLPIALRIYAAATPDEREQLEDSLARKMDSIDNLPIDQQENLMREYDRLHGIETEPQPKKQPLVVPKGTI